MTVYVLKRYYKVIGITVLGISIIVISVSIILLMPRLIPVSALTFIFLFLLCAVVFCAVKIIRESVGGIWTHKFTINEHGVEYKKKYISYYLKWSEVKSIEIIPKNKPRLLPKRNKSSMVCFNGNDFINGSDKDMESFDPLFFGVQYRDSIIKEIQKYSDLYIQGLYDVIGKSSL